MSDLLKVEGHPGYLKDTRTGAVISGDRSAFNVFKAKKQKEQDLQNKIQNMESKIDSMEAMLKEILGKL